MQRNDNLELNYNAQDIWIGIHDIYIYIYNISVMYLLRIMKYNVKRAVFIAKKVF